MPLHPERRMTGTPEGAALLDAHTDWARAGGALQAQATRRGRHVNFLRGTPTARSEAAYGEET